MSVLRRHFWFIAAAAITLIFAGVSLLVRRGPSLTDFADVSGLFVMLATTGILYLNALTRPDPERWFWALMAFGSSLWAFNQGVWAYNECILHRDIPDPCFADIILFFHLVPIISAVAWRPDHFRQEGWFGRSSLNFLMLLTWWMFLYAFIVFPHQYVVIDKALYDRYYNSLYEIENVLLLAVLGIAAWASSGAWRRLYLHLLAASAVYTFGSQVLDEAVGVGTYFSGSLYDIPVFAAATWIAATAISARKWNLTGDAPRENTKWKTVIPHLASLAILSLPPIGLWAFLADRSPIASRMFRLFTVLGAMLILGAFLFLRQYLQDQALMDLLDESRQSFESQQRLQSHLVQKEKLASLGHLVAGAAQEINHPVASIMASSEQLWSQERLTPEQDKMVRKIVDQARRTRALVSNLLSFAQQAPGEKAPVDLNILLHRGAQIQESRHHTNRIRVEISIGPDFPRVQGNANQLFQALTEIIENAMDALEEKGGGSLRISAIRHNGEAEIQFSDTGPGVREPERVFDPFYTTKPIGKGTGLGLSAVYGVIQDHGGQITCQNKPEGGALFQVRIPLAAESAPQAASAAQA
jgi:signal transduction histidine kinase